jgi:hypothetical protein
MRWGNTGAEERRARQAAGERLWLALFEIQRLPALPPRRPS